MKKLFKAILVALGLILVAALVFILFLTVNEYKPDDVTDAISVNTGSPYTQVGEKITVLSWNIGYAGLGEESDFVMDGGKSVRQTKDITLKNLEGITDFLSTQNADICLLQEVDVDSKRTYGINETETLSSALGMSGVFAYNYNCAYVPFPLPTIGRVQSGLLTLSAFSQNDGQRISLPCSFSWPIRTANLKRCLLVSYIDLPDSDKQLVIVNLHLEAYDNGDGKTAQLEMLRDFIASEYEKGNYVIAGGDFNHSFPDTLESYPNTHPDLWEPGTLESDFLSDGWNLAFDSTTPTCRLLNQAYDPSDRENTQYYIIDGFILSPNIELLSVCSINEDFKYSDHNPVKLEIRLK